MHAKPSGRILPCRSAAPLCVHDKYFRVIMTKKLGASGTDGLQGRFIGVILLTVMASA